MVNSTPSTDDDAPLKYLLEVYKLYHGHINTMFNYFLIMSGLIGNAYIQAIQKNEDRSLSVAVALFGALMSMMSLFIHLRSRNMLDTIEKGLCREENRIFQPGNGFLNALPSGTSWFRRHKYQFPFTYLAFATGFLLMAAYAGRNELAQLATSIWGHSQL